MMNRFNVRVGSVFTPFLLLIGVVKGKAHVTIEGERLNLRYGFFHYQVPLTEVVAAEQIHWPLMWGIGLRVAPGLTLGCVADYRGVVRLTFAQPMKLSPLLRLFGIGYRHLAISVEQPEAFLQALAARDRRRAA